LKIEKNGHIYPFVRGYILERRFYPVQMTINGYKIKIVIIDSHYEVKHSATMTDELILKLVGLLDGGDYSAESVVDSFEYYMIDNLFVDGKRYRLIWLIEKEQLFVGVINAFRRK
jgi:hypothetical protein